MCENVDFSKESSATKRLKQLVYGIMVYLLFILYVIYVGLDPTVYTPYDL